MFFVLELEAGINPQLIQFHEAYDSLQIQMMTQLKSGLNITQYILEFLDQSYKILTCTF